MLTVPLVSQCYCPCRWKTGYFHIWDWDGFSCPKVEFQAWVWSYYSGVESPFLMTLKVEKAKTRYKRLPGSILPPFMITNMHTCDLSTFPLALSQCLKITHKVSFYNIASEASYDYFQIHLNIKMRYFRRFSNTVMCYFWDCDKTI